MDKREFDWAELLALIEAREVILVVGRDLLTTETANGKQLFHRLLAEKLAVALNIPESNLPADYQLNEVAMAFLKSGERPNPIYSCLNTVLKNTPLEIPPSLLKLAEITDFDLYISTTSDDLLTRALNLVRHGDASASCTPTLNYSMHGLPKDLPQMFGQNRNGLVFKVFGSVGPLPTYAVTDEDMLEFLHCLQKDLQVNDPPSRLFEYIYKRNLLLVGCGYPDWLARFFIRTLSQQRLQKMGDTTRFVVDRETKTDNRLMLFLRDWHMEIYPEGEPDEFVDELYLRWQKQNSLISRSLAASTPMKDGPEPMQPGSIFLSYYHEDLEAVLVLNNILENAGLDVWFDKSRLGSGDAWESKIDHYIRTCSLFLPIISHNSANCPEGFYRREWSKALDRAQDVAPHVPFIIPIIIDDTAPSSTKGVPDFFWKRQLEYAPAGLPPLEVVNRLKEAFREHQFSRRRK